jgi:hypothetical protein
MDTSKETPASKRKRRTITNAQRAAFHREIGALDFEPLTDIDEGTQARLRELTLALWCASHMLKMSKAEMIARAGDENGLKATVLVLERLVIGREAAELLRDVIRSAEVRTAVALANASPSDGDGNQSAAA